ncbi:MAG: trigger factor [Pseudomonadales bacterium]|nr:trigger factor [Pseudomonadales bacterium]
MQVSVETTSNLERRLTITIEADKINQAVDARVKQVAPQVNLNGFRKGKVPFRVVKQQYGAGIRQEVLGEMMSQSFGEAVTQENLKPAGQPQVEPTQNDPKKDFIFTASFEVYPEFTLGSLSGVEIKQPVTEITAQDVDDMIQTLRKQQASFEEVEKAAETGDQVNIDFEGLKDGEPFEGGTAQGTDLVLGSGQMIPGFEDGLLAAQAGDEKSLDLTFPEDYHAEELKGQAVVFKVKVNSVKAQQLPEIDEEFMKKFGVEEGGEEALKVEVEKNMSRELKQALKNRVKTQVMDAMLEKNNDVQVPSALIDQEISAMRQQMMQQFGGQAQQMNLDENLLPAELFQDQAQRRVSLGLILSKAIEDKDLSADDDKVRETIEEIASAYEAADEVIDYYYNNEQQLQQVKALVLEDMVVEALMADADVSDEALSYEELMKLQQQQPGM